MDLPEHYQISPFSDHKAAELAIIGPCRVANTVEPETHVLLAATSANGYAREPAARGAFTRALLELLRRHCPSELSYKEVVRRLPELPEYALPAHLYLAVAYQLPQSVSAV